MLYHSMLDSQDVKNPPPFVYDQIVDDICSLAWNNLANHDILQIAHAYYYFSIQFRENLTVALQLFPRDPALERLHQEECNTDNLSPWPEVAGVGEKLDHDEFMRRLLAFPSSKNDMHHIIAAGDSYLTLSRNADPMTRALSIVSYEDGGLTKIFSAILRAPDWSGKGQEAFRYFLEKHLLFDTDPDEGHGALCRHLKPDDRIVPLWAGFQELLITSVPKLLGVSQRPGCRASQKPARAALTYRVGQ
jgi:hypothetical protein